jgi:hypothetical protein
LRSDVVTAAGSGSAIASDTVEVTTTAGPEIANVVGIGLGDDEAAVPTAVGMLAAGIRATGDSTGVTGATSGAGIGSVVGAGSGRDTGGMRAVGPASVADELGSATAVPAMASTLDPETTSATVIRAIEILRCSRDAMEETIRQ